MKPFVITVIALALIAFGYILSREKPEQKSYSVPVGAQAGDLSVFESCEHQPGKRKMMAECATLTILENWDDPASRLIALPVVRLIF